MDSPVPSQPQPRSLIVLVTGCSILVELVAHGVDTVTITGLQAEVAGSSEVPFDGVQRTMSAMPDLIGSDDLAEPMRESVTNYRPLDPPISRSCSTGGHQSSDPRKARHRRQSSSRSSCVPTARRRSSSRQSPRTRD